MRRARGRLLGTVVILAALVSVLMVGPSYGHTSTYCGHGMDGIVYYTVFKHHHDTTGYAHIHGYTHYRYHQADGLEYLHHVHRGC